MRPVCPAVVLAALAVVSSGKGPLPMAAIAQQPPASGTPPLNGLVWTFVRIRYNAWPEKRDEYLRDYGMEPWAVDWPAAEENLSRRIRTATTLEAGDPLLLTLDDSRLWDHAWIYFVEPGTLRLTDEEVPLTR
jgi:hypothetical protein